MSTQPPPAPPASAGGPWPTRIQISGTPRHWKFTQHLRTTRPPPGAMVLGKLPVPGRPTIWITVGQGPTALTVGAGGGCLDIFTLIYPFSPLSPTLWETARYRLKYCLKGPLNQKQPTNQPYCNQNCRTPRRWKFTQHHRTTRPPHVIHSPFP